MPKRNSGKDAFCDWRQHLHAEAMHECADSQSDFSCLQSVSSKNSSTSIPLNQHIKELSLTITIFCNGALARCSYGTSCHVKLLFLLLLAPGSTNGTHGTRGFIKLLFLLFLSTGSALTSIPPAGVGLSRPEYCNMPRVEFDCQRAIDRGSSLHQAHE